MKVNYEKAIKVNNLLKVNVDVEQDDNFFFKDQCDIGNKDEVQKIRAARTPMKKKKTRVCDM